MIRRFFYQSLHKFSALPPDNSNWSTSTTNCDPTHLTLTGLTTSTDDKMPTGLSVVWSWTVEFHGTTRWFIISGTLCWNWYSSANERYYCAKKLTVCRYDNTTHNLLNNDFIVWPLPVCCKSSFVSIKCTMCVSVQNATWFSTIYCVRSTLRSGGKYFLRLTWQRLRQLGQSFVKFCRLDYY